MRWTGDGVLHGSFSPAKPPWRANKPHALLGGLYCIQILIPGDPVCKVRVLDYQGRGKNFSGSYTFPQNLHHASRVSNRLPPSKAESTYFKIEVALEAVNGLQTTSQIASMREVHPNKISAWKPHPLTEGASFFGPQQSERRRPSAKPNCLNRLGGSKWNWPSYQKSPAQNLFLPLITIVRGLGLGDKCKGSIRKFFLLAFREEYLGF